MAGFSWDQPAVRSVRFTIHPDVLHLSQDAPSIWLPLATTIWGDVSETSVHTLEGHKSDVYFAMYWPMLPITVIGSEGGDNLGYCLGTRSTAPCTRNAVAAVLDAQETFCRSGENQPEGRSRETMKGGRKTEGFNTND